MSVSITFEGGPIDGQTRTFERTIQMHDCYETEAAAKQMRGFYTAYKKPGGATHAKWYPLPTTNRRKT